MKINGQWVGWGLGDNDPKIREIKLFLTKKFQWVRDARPPLNDTNEYDAALVAVVMEMQRRYGMPASGVMNWATQAKCGFWKADIKRLPIAMSVHGTGQADPFGPGLPADVCRHLHMQDKCRWQPIGNYPATAFPMWPSVMQGVAELALQVERYPLDDIWLVGYSQGAIVVSYYWSRYVQDPKGPHHHRFHDPAKPRSGTIKKVVTFGNPMREQGIAHWDNTQNPIRRSSGGILEDRLVNTPTYWRDYAHQGDMYADCEFDDEGEYKRAICKIIMGNEVFTGTDSLLAQVLELGQQPTVEAIAMFKAIIDAGLFFGTGTRAHMYDIRAAIDFLAS